MTDTNYISTPYTLVSKSYGLWLDGEFVREPTDEERENVPEGLELRSDWDVRVLPRPHWDIEEYRTHGPGVTVLLTGEPWHVEDILKNPPKPDSQVGESFTMHSRQDVDNVIAELVRARDAMFPEV